MTRRVVVLMDCRMIEMRVERVSDETQTLDFMICMPLHTLLHTQPARQQGKKKKSEKFQISLSNKSEIEDKVLR